MNEEGLGKIQEETLDWVSDWLNHDYGIRKLEDKLRQYLSSADLTTLRNEVINEMWCQMEFDMTDAIVEWCENRYYEEADE